jgi:hypothetical protein
LFQKGFFEWLAKLASHFFLEKILFLWYNFIKGAGMKTNNTIAEFGKRYDEYAKIAEEKNKECSEIIDRYNKWKKNPIHDLLFSVYFCFLVCHILSVIFYFAFEQPLNADIYFYRTLLFFILWVVIKIFNGFYKELPLFFYNKKFLKTDKAYIDAYNESEKNALLALLASHNELLKSALKKDEWSDKLRKEMKKNVSSVDRMLKTHLEN